MPAMATTTQEQQDGLYAVMCAIAARCDGAQSKDEQGFNGVDTHFGRRIVMVPKDQWTPEIFSEVAHIVLKYREQGIRYTGIDVATFPMVREAQDFGTNYTARNQARGFEKRAKHLAARTIDVVDGRLGIRWASGDPEFSTFLKLAQALPGRRWDSARKVNVVNVSRQVAVFIDEHDFTPSPEAQALLEALDARRPGEAPAQDMVPTHYDIWLGTDGRVVVKTNLTAPGQPAAEAVRNLPGRAFSRALYANTANATPQVLAFAQAFKLTVHPDAVRACEAAQAALEATQAADLAQADIRTVMNAVSRCGKPEDLPAAFVMMMREILP